MARLTVTLDEDMAHEVQELPALAERIRPVLEAVLESAGAEERNRLLTYLVRALDDLGDSPSTSAVMREAVGYFLSALKEADRIGRLEAGYAASATEPERSDAMGFATSRAAALSAHEG